MSSHKITEKVLGAETHWLMGRVMPRDFLDEIGKYLNNRPTTRLNGHSA